MAGEDIIIKALVQAGLQLNEGDAEALENRLARIGTALGKGGEESFKAMQARATKLMALRTKLEKDLVRVQEAATSGNSLRDMSPREQQLLTSSYNRVKAYQDQLKKLTGQLSGLGDNTGIPIFREMGKLNAQFANFGALMRQVAPQIDNVTRAQKANALALKKQAADERQRAAQQVRAQVIDRGRATNKLTNKAGAEAFFRGSQDGFLSLSKTSEAKAAKAFGQAELALREKAWKLIGDTTGFNSKETKLAARDVDVAAKAVDRLNNRLVALGEADKLAAKDQAKAERLAKTERGVAQSRQNRSKTERDGAAAFMAAGGVRGDVTGFASSDKAAKAMKFAKGELDDMLRLQTALTDAYGAGSKQVKALAKDTAAYGSYVGKLNPQIEALKAAEAEAKVREREAKQEARAVVSQAEREDARREARKIRMRELERSREVANQLDGGAGRAAFRSGYANDFTSLKLKDAEAAERFAKGELDARVNVEKATRKALGATHEETLRAQAEVDRLTNAYGRLINRVNDLKLSATGVDRDRVAAETFNKKRDLIADSRTQRATTDVYGKAALDRAGGALITDVSKITGLQEAKAALGFLKGEYRDTRAEAAALTDAFGKGDAAARQATTRVGLQAEGIAKLEAHIRTLTDAQEKQTAAQRIAAIRTASDTARKSNKPAFTLMDRGFADPKSLTNLKDVKTALAAGTAELGRMQSIQKILGTTAGEASTEYKQMTAEIHRAADALTLLRQREGDLNAEIALARENAKKDPMRSNIYGDGKAAYAANRHAVGGLEALRGNERDQARSYVQARLAESRRQYDIMSRTMPAGSAQVTQAAAAVREYEENLRRLNGTGARTNDMMHGLGSAFKTFLKYAIIYQAMYQIIAAFTALGRSVVKLETEMLEIQAVTGSTVSEMTKLGAVVQSVARDSKFSLEELTKAAKTLAQAGVPIVALNSTLQATANFAAATGTNLETAADLLSTTRDVFKELNDDVIANQLAKAINVSKLTGEDLKTILSLGAQTADSFGLTAEQFLGAVATLRNAGLKSSTVATGLRQGMLEIFTPDNMLVKALQTRYREMGETMGEEAVKARFFAFTQAQNPLVSALTELKRLGFADEGQMVLSRAFDVRSTNAIKALIANLEEVAKNESQITFGRAAAEGAAITVEGLNASLTRLYSTITGFTYNSSDGLLGFLASTVQELDKAIQRWERIDTLRKAGLGKSDKELEASGLGVAREDSYLMDGFDQWVSRLFTDRPQMLKDNVRGTDAQISRAELDSEKLTKEADSNDIARARRGDGEGTGAKQIVMAAAAADNLNAMVANTFGPGMVEQEGALKQLLHGYSNLTESQRKVRRGELRAQFENLENLSDLDFDKTFFEMERVREDLAGKLIGISTEMNIKVANASRLVREQLRDRAPESVEEVAAVALLELHKNDEQMQAILAGHTQLTADAQIEVAEKFSQTLADKIRASGGSTEQQLGRLTVSRLRDTAKLLAETASPGAGQVEMRGEVARVLAAQKESTEATVAHLKMLRAIMLETSDGLGAGASGLFTQAVLQVQQAITAGEKSVLEQTAARVSTFNELLLPALSDPNFKETVLKRPDADPNKASLLQMIDNPPTAETIGAAGNDPRFKMLDEQVRLYNNTQAKFKLVEDEFAKDNKWRLDMENRKGDADARFSEAQARNRFGEARAAKADAAAAESAILQRKIDKANSDIELNLSRNEPEKNNQLLEERARLQNDLLRVAKDLTKATAELNQQEEKVNNQRATKAANAEKSRLDTVLKNVNMDTPQSVIDATIAAYDANQDELAALFEKQKALEGDKSKMSADEEAERREALKHYKDQNAYLDMHFRIEQQKRDALLRLLDAPLSTGDATEDARLGRLGVAPGGRTERAGYLAGQGGVMRKWLESAQAELDSYRAQYDRNRAEMEANPQAPKNKVLAQDQEDLRRKMIGLEDGISQWSTRLGEVNNDLRDVTQSFRGAIDAGFDLNSVILGLEQSESSVEHLAYKITDSLITGIEGVGDAFADALLEGEDFFESLDKLFADTGKQILRDVIKTYTTETMLGFLKPLTAKGRAESNDPNAVGNPLGSGLGGLVKTGTSLIKDGWNWLTGSGGQHTPALDDGEGNGVSALVGSVGPAGEIIKSVGGGLRPDEMGDLGGIGGAVAGVLGMGGAEGGGPGGKGCCCDGGLGDVAKDVIGASPLEDVLTGGKPAGDGVLADVADTEGKGFFSSIKDGFFGLIDGLKGGFGGMLEGLGGLLGLGGGGGGGGAFGMLASVFGFKNGGLIKAATGGIITGPGTGTSDSVPGFIRSRSGKLKPLLTSTGESILNAKATSFLGADGVHALNSGQFVQANTDGMRGEISGMMRAMKAGSVGAGAAAPKGPTKNYNTTQVAVTPAQMRMRMGDWLEQHVIEELSKR